MKDTLMKKLLLFALFLFSFTFAIANPNFESFPDGTIMQYGRFNLINTQEPSTEVELPIQWPNYGDYAIINGIVVDATGKVGTLVFIEFMPTNAQIMVAARNYDGTPPYQFIGTFIAIGQ